MTFKTVVVAYIPALHRGYIDFLRKHLKLQNGPSLLLVLNTEFVREFTNLHLERDLRAIHSREMVYILSRFFDETVCCVRETDKNYMKDSSLWLSNESEIIMPDEDISRVIVNKYLAGINVVFENVFLRWDGNRALLEKEIEGVPTISKSDLVERIFHELENEAQKSSDWWRQLAAAAVRDREILIMAHNRHMPSPQSPNILGDPRSNFNAGEHLELSTADHAESGVIAHAARKGISLERCSIYATVFPCPPCAKLIAGAGIEKLYFEKGYSRLDSLDVLKDAGVEIVRVTEK